MHCDKYNLPHYSQYKFCWNFLTSIYSHLFKDAEHIAIPFKMPS